MKIFIKSFFCVLLLSALLIGCSFEETIYIGEEERGEEFVLIELKFIEAQHNYNFIERFHIGEGEVVGENMYEGKYSIDEDILKLSMRGITKRGEKYVNVEEEGYVTYYKIVQMNEEGLILEPAEGMESNFEYDFIKPGQLYPYSMETPKE